MRLEWDEAKRIKNIARHGIDFLGLELLFDAETHTVTDDRYDYGEIRYLTLGFLNGEVMAISHLEEDDIIRIISARKAQKHEQEIYFREIRD